MTAIKFCGLTRSEDAAAAVSCGASYLGVIFASGPRLVTPARAAEVLRERGTARAVGVFGEHTVEEIADVARDARLDVIQLHGDPDVAFLSSLRSYVAGEIWAVVRTDPGGGKLPAMTDALFECADAVVLDARVAGRRGGTGVALSWEALAPAINAMRGARARLVLAGGLAADNVAHAIAVLSPDVVDVSSRVESAPGIKDHLRMRAFVSAVRSAEAVQA